MDFFYVRYSTLYHLPPLRFTVSEYAEFEPRTVATLALAVRPSCHSVRSHPRCSASSHPHTRLDLIHTWLDLIHIRLDLIYTKLDLTQVSAGSLPSPG